jgi:prepilin-type processing-associated H-X9-DG protein
MGTSGAGLGDAAFMTWQDGTNGKQYENYWKNIGNGKWGWDVTGTTTFNGTDATKIDVVSAAERHSGFVNCQFIDGHVKAVKYEKAVGDICLWATDIAPTDNGVKYQTSDHSFCN